MTMNASGVPLDVKALYAALSERFDPSLIKQRAGGGGKMLDYIEAHTVIRRLNEACIEHGAEWNFSVLDVKVVNDLEITRGSLSISGLGTREHVGVQNLGNRSGEDAVAKGGASDCLKKCATLFGVGLHLYESDDAPAWNQPRPQQQARQERYPDRTAQASVSYGHASGGEKAASEKQIGLLKRLGYKGPIEGLSMRQAGEEITRPKEGPQDPAPADYREPVAPPPPVRRGKDSPTRLSDFVGGDDINDMDDPFSD